MVQDASTQHIQQSLPVVECPARPTDEHRERYRQLANVIIDMFLAEERASAHVPGTAARRMQ